MQELVYKTIYFDDAELEFKEKINSFPIEKIGTKWIYLKGINKINLPPELSKYYNTYNAVTTNVEEYKSSKKIEEHYIKVNRDIFGKVYFEGVHFGIWNTTAVYMKENDSYINYVSTDTLRKELITKQMKELEYKNMMLKKLVAEYGKGS